MEECWSSLPRNFDLIVVGTGLPESLLAAAASAAGKTVLQVDPNPFHAFHFASLPIHDFTDFLQTHSSSKTQTTGPTSSGGHSLFPLTTRRVYSSVEVNAYSSVDFPPAFKLDLAGPRVFLCRDPMVELILKTGINELMHFRGVDRPYIYEGDLWEVPDSRSALFSDETLNGIERYTLMNNLFKPVEEHYRGVGLNSQIPEEDLETPFAEYLSREIGLSPRLKSAILYAISMADYDQDNEKFSERALKTREGIERLMLYKASDGRFPNIASGAIMYPMYGQGELSQVFCHHASVKGCIRAVRMPVVGLLGDKEVGNYKGVRLATGQEVFSHRLILAPSFVVPSGLVFPPSHPQKEAIDDLSLPNESEKVARAVCITKSSLKSGVENCLIFLPPQSLGPEQQTSVRAFQVGSKAAVCPLDLFVVYLSTICEDAVQGKKLISAAIDALFTFPDSKKISAESTDKRVKPTLLWSILYAQDLTGVASDSDHSTFMPDGNLLYNDLLDRTTKLFHKIYPNEDFFPKTTPHDDLVEDVEYDV